MVKKLVIQSTGNKLYWTGGGWTNLLSAAAKYNSPNELPGYLLGSTGSELELILRCIDPISAQYFLPKQDNASAIVIELNK